MLVRLVVYICITHFETLCEKWIKCMNCLIKKTIPFTSDRLDDVFEYFPQLSKDFEKIKAIIIITLCILTEKS